MESLGADLRGHGNGEHRRKDRRSGQVAEVHRHRHRIAAGLAEGGCEYLDDPESQGDFRNLARALGVDPVFAVLIHAASLSLDADGGAYCRRRGCWHMSNPTLWASGFRY